MRIFKYGLSGFWLVPGFDYRPGFFSLSQGHAWDFVRFKYSHDAGTYRPRLEMTVFRH